MATASLGMEQNPEPTGVLYIALKVTFWITKLTGSFLPVPSNSLNFPSHIQLTILTLHGCLLWLEVYPTGELSQNKYSAAI